MKQVFLLTIQVEDFIGAKKKCDGEERGIGHLVSN